MSANLSSALKARNIKTHVSEKMALTAGQIRAARALLDWNQQTLSEESGVSLATIRRIESPRGPDRSTAPNKEAIQRSLEKAGVVFLAKDSHGGAGVRLKR